MRDEARGSLLRQITGTLVAAREPLGAAATRRGNPVGQAGSRRVVAAGRRTRAIRDVQVSGRTFVPSTTYRPPAAGDWGERESAPLAVSCVGTSRKVTISYLSTSAVGGVPRLVWVRSPGTGDGSKTGLRLSYQRGNDFEACGSVEEAGLRLLDTRSR